MKNKMRKITSLLLILIFVFCICLLSSCKDDDDIYYVDENTRYRYDVLNTTIMGAPFAMVLDNSESYIQFNTDKTVNIRFMANSTLLKMLQSEIDLDDLIEKNNVEKYFNFYAPEILPGASIDDLSKSLYLLGEAFDVTFVGMDFINEQSEELSSILKKEKPVPENYNIPDELGFEYNGVYYIKDVQTDNGIVKGVFIGEYNEKTDPYIIMTMFEETDDSGNTINKLSYRLEPPNMVCELKQTEIK